MAVLGLAGQPVHGAESAGSVVPQSRVIASAAEFSILSPRERVEPENLIVAERLDSLLPKLMAEVGLDMWLVINREYAEDPVYFTLVPQPSLAARRTTMLVFHRQADGTVAKLSVNRYPLGAPYESAWAGGDLDAQWRALAALITQKNPARIGINVSPHWPVADGLTHALHERLVSELPTDIAQRLVSAENLTIRWLETRTASELEMYPYIVGIARGVIAEAFSSRVITPGVTTTDDVAWYIRERFESMGLPIWFMPYVNRQAAGIPCEKDTAFCGVSGVIRQGDVLHTDVGICYLKLCTDTQEMGYVARVGESEVPAGLRAAMTQGNRWQDILTSQFVTGRTGNQVLAATRAAADKEKIVSSTYTHPLGFVGHAPGPTIGMWDNQGPTPVQGDWPLYPSTVYAIEGNIKHALPEWQGQWVQVKLEQSAVFDGERVVYLAGRQATWHLIK